MQSECVRVNSSARNNYGKSGIKVTFLNGTRSYTLTTGEDMSRRRGTDWNRKEVVVVVQDRTEKWKNETSKWNRSLE